MDPINHINLIMGTLDGVRVSGRENWDRLLGCMQALEELKMFLTKEASDGRADRPED